MPPNAPPTCSTSGGGGEPPPAPVSSEVLHHLLWPVELQVGGVVWSRTAIHSLGDEAVATLRKDYERGLFGAHDLALPGGGRRPRRRFLGEKAVAASFLVHLGAVSFFAYAFGPLVIPIAERYAVGRGAASWVQSIAAGATPCAGVLAVAVVKALEGPLKSSLRANAATMCVATVGLLLCFLTAAYAPASRAGLYVLYAALGVGGGLFSGVVYFDTLPTPSQLFRSDRRSLATGLATAGAGLGNFVWPYVVAAALGPLGWEVTFIALGAACAACQGAAAALSLHVKGTVAARAARRRSLRREAGEDAARTRTGLFALARRGDVQGLLWANLFNGIASGVPFAHLIPYASDLGFSPAFTALLQSLLGAGSLGGRVLGGLIADRVGAGRLYVATYFLTAALIAAWPLCQSAASLVGLAVVFGAAMGASMAITAPMATEVFGVDLVAEAIVIVVLGKGPARLLAGPIVGYMYDALGSYTAAIELAAGLALLATGLATAVICRGSAAALVRRLHRRVRRPEEREVLLAPAPRGPSALHLGEDGGWSAG